MHGRKNDLPILQMSVSYVRRNRGNREGTVAFSLSNSGTVKTGLIAYCSWELFS